MIMFQSSFSKRTASLLAGFLLLIQNGFSAEPKKLVLGAGCFWCVEAYYEALPGVIEVVSGYAGGNNPNPTYQDVSAGRTTHAEVVEITYDPEKTSLRKLIDFFWTTHDVTNGNGVAPDFGRQYRSIILFGNEEEKAVIEDSKASYQNSGKIRKPIATEIKPLDRFYKAESYHQDYAKKHPNDGYIRAVTAPKMKKLGLPMPKSKP
jgi:peptide-methionine (S)-S-oxide reductase